MTAFHDPDRFAFTRALEAAFAAILAELLALDEHDEQAFVASPDSLTTVANGYDENGWYYFALFGGGADGTDPRRLAANRIRCPATARACAAVPGLENAGFSRFRPGTHLYPHQGEMAGVLRCHLPLVIPAGDVGLRFGDELRRWQVGRCLVFDDTIEHEAWNHAATDRTVLLVTFAAT